MKIVDVKRGKKETLIAGILLVTLTIVPILISDELLPGAGRYRLFYFGWSNSRVVILGPFLGILLSIFLLRRSRIAWRFTLFVSIIAFASAFINIFQVEEGSVLGWFSLAVVSGTITWLLALNKNVRYFFSVR